MLCLDTNPKVGVSIEHSRERMQYATCHKNVKILKIFPPEIPLSPNVREKWDTYRFQILHIFCYRPTMSAFNGEIAPITSPFSFSGTWNLSSVATRSLADASQSASVIPKPVCAVLMSCPV